MLHIGRVAATAAVTLLLSSVFAAQSADVPPEILACIANGTKVRHTFIQHPDPAKLKEAVRLYESRVENADYPEGTIFRMIPGEAMVKRSKAAFPQSNGWEYFALGVTPQGTTVRARGMEANNPLGTCQSCHAGATKSDYVCGGGPGCAAVPLTEERIGQIQANDPRCGTNR
ncbi:MAG: cytochrome P460 family protein [Acidobacteria bacterium]|nr:cytochrome P460 family protein [Acidobacteriota bacterium]